MKKIAFISDVHANLPALEAVEADIEKQKIDEVYCTGDTIGYGASPAECFKKVQKLTRGTMLMGNHERFLCAGSDNLYGEGINPLAAEGVIGGVRYAEIELSAEEIAAIRELPARLYLKSKDIGIAHGSYCGRGTKDYTDIYVIKDALSQYHVEGQGPGVCVVGHVHRPAIFSDQRGRIDHLAPGKSKMFFLHSSEKMVINAGSVGQPRDGDSRACYLIIAIDSAGKIRFWFRRVKYDIAAAQKKILYVGLPKYLAERLSEGR